MKYSRSLQIGNFGGSLKQIDGQTIKTVMFDLLLKKIHKKNKTIDIYKYNIVNYIFLYISLPFHILKSDYIYIGLGRKGMTRLAPWAIFLSVLFKRKIIYYVIGGWIFDLLSNNNKLIPLFKKFHAILVELPSMVNNGRSIGIENIYFFPNFRTPTFTPKIKKTSNKNLKLLYYSRVIKEKGIMDVINTVENLSKNKFNISLDIYGPLIEPKIIESENNKIIYKGILNPLSPNLYNEINKYDILIFPTYYDGEGFPGAILDAFIAGVPVIATDWKYNSEIIINGENGELFPPRNISLLYDKISLYYNNPSRLDTLKKNAQLHSYKYSFDNAKAILSALII
ncbi:glycosyltransferase [Providencia rettgeri]|uniref:glycosyltransferase n=1 Tax=Providencia rettgeri TaxID=587 RepID=UPI003D2C26E7